MLEFLKRWWAWMLVFLTALYLAVLLFLAFPIFAVGIATIPLNSAIEKKLELSPILRKCVTALVFAILLAISWFVGEIVVVLAALAICFEIPIAYRCFKNRFRRTATA